MAVRQNRVASVFFTVASHAAETHPPRPRPSARRDVSDSPFATFNRAVGDATDQVIAPIWKIYPATSHAEQYIINSRYCGNLLWQSGLTLYHTAM